MVLNTTCGDGRSPSIRGVFGYISSSLFDQECFASRSRTVDIRIRCFGWTTIRILLWFVPRRTWLAADER
ncbi:hypothetical protein DOTSEDRAFT_74421, partial [Dothistroma septosporum NZE10]